ncbi:MAG: GH3 auxin-responsive promoter family protein, partial [Opitutaceae bacterium]|nr:GH3 auxin-responsive promoter family protein [Opitutaceae bacterium]
GNPIYESKRSQKKLDAPLVRLIIPGVFKKWMIAHQKWGGQNKIPRVSTNRQIADGLTEIAGFSEKSPMLWSLGQASLSETLH